MLAAWLKVHFVLSASAFVWLASCTVTSSPEREGGNHVEPHLTSGVVGTCMVTSQELSFLDSIVASFEERDAENETSTADGVY